MASTYTVKSGDTLSAIASRYGVPLSSISGYKSGNPNLIYPGENLSIGGSTGATTGFGALLAKEKAAVPTVASPKAASVAAPTYSSQAVNTPSSLTPRSDFINQMTSDFRSQDTERAKASKEAQDKLISFYQGLEDPTSRYTRISSEQGLPQQQELVNAVTRQVLDTEGVIRDLEPAVNERVGDFLVTEGDKTSILARERDPHVKALTQLLQSKQYEEVGLSGKQNLVSQLLQLSYQGDELRAKPLQLGVDFTESDRKQARDLFVSLLSPTASAYSADLSAEESRQASERKFQQDKELESIKASNAAVKKSYDTATENAWNDILSRSTTEADVSRTLNMTAPLLQKQGIDVDELWAKHKALAGKVGIGADIRSSGSDLGGLYDILSKIPTK